MRHRLYDSPKWSAARTRILARDADRCTVARLIGGPCHARLDVHHLIPVEEGGAPYDDDNLVTVCARHHPMLEALRRWLLRRRQIRPCRHRHRYDHARRECLERRLREAA